MNHMDPIFQNLYFYCTKKVPTKHNNLCPFPHRGETHFQVFAQTLIVQNISFYKWKIYIGILIQFGYKFLPQSNLGNRAI